MPPKLVLSTSGTNFADWPISYAELEPYYTKVDWEIGVSGTPGPFDAPRSKPFPMPPMPIKSSGVLLEKGANALGLHAQAAPLAILSQPHNGRAGCIHCGFCMMFGCEIGAKSSTLAAMIPLAEASGHCEIRPLSVVIRIDTDANGRASQVVYYFDARLSRVFATKPPAMIKATQLLGISNAIVDILAHVDHGIIEKLQIVPGSMTLVDERRASEIYAMTGPATEMSGGSVANSIAGFANLGGSAAYIGRVKADQFGEIFNHDMRSLGVDIRLQPGKDGTPTARSHVLITPDGQRTMNTYLGACTELSARDVTAESVATPQAILLEGYVWDLPEGPALTRKAIELGHAAGASIALSLSDSFCVERHREAFADVVRNRVDIVLANEQEVCKLLQADSFEEMLDAIRAYDNLFAITRSEQGSVIVQGATVVTQAANRIENLVDSTGAGDAYSAGFLFGWVNRYSLAECARLGTFCASRVIQQLGARIERGLLDDYT